jgi:hypothetical protein
MITEQPGFKYEAPFRSSFLSPWEALLLLGTTRLLYSIKFLCVFGTKLGKGLVDIAFIPVYKPHTRKLLYIFRHCTNIVFITKPLSFNDAKWELTCDVLLVF